MTTRSVWDDLDERIKELIREADKQLDAADALAEKAEQLLECIRMGWAHGEECIALDAAVREYREVTK